MRASQSRRAGLVWLILVLCGLPHACGARPAALVKVVGVADGDSLVVLQDGERTRVRLAEIDAPEHGQPWSERSRKALRDKVMNKSVRLAVVATDRYGRTVAHVWLSERDINRELVREGQAWAYSRYMTDETLRADEARARDARLGLWSMANPIEPWRWRQQHPRSGSQ